MVKSEIKIFIVDDDPTMGKALLEAVKKEGYGAILCTNPADALNQFKIQGAHAFIIDCLLPKMSGVEFASQLRTEGAPTVPIFLTSGVFKDKAFIKDAIQKTSALHFFTKPFNITELTKVLNDAVSELADEVLHPIESLLTSYMTPMEKIKTINLIGEIESLELPFIYCGLINSNCSGILKLEHAKTPVSITFVHGRIVQVDMKSPESFFGHLLIENGFLTTEQLDTALKANTTKRIGERLVELNFLSPHAIDIINAEQLALRLSMSINNEVFKISFEEQNTTPNHSFIDAEKLAPFIFDWMNSKINISWLKQKYLKWIEKPVVKNNIESKWNRVWSFPLLTKNAIIVQKFENGQDLEDVLAQHPQAEEAVYQVFHILVLIEHIKFQKENKKTLDLSAHLQRLKKIYADLKNQDHFSILGVNKTAKTNDIKKTYHELAKIFHPDKLPSNASQELKEIAQTVFALMSKSYEILTNDAKRTAYLKELEMGRAEKILQAENLFEDGKAILTTGQAQKALEKFKLAQSLKPATSDLLIYIAWALLASSEQNKNSSQIQEAEGILNKIAPEDRHNATYYFVKGFFQKMTNDFVAARKNILHALSLKPKFIEAERLLRFLEMQKTNKPVDILNSDLKDVVGSLFKKS